MTKFLFILVVCVLCVEVLTASENLEITNSYRFFANKPFIDNIWNSPQQLQPYYDFISKVRVMLENTIKGVDSGFEVWPTPNPFYSRTLDCVYLQVSNQGKHIDHLWTPLGEVKLLGFGIGHSIRRVSMAFMEQIKTISTLKDVTGEIEQSYWHFGEILKRDYLGGKVYRLTWKEHNVTCSDKIFVHVDANIKYEREREIFSVLSNGRNKF